MSVITNTLKNSRKEANFLSYYMRNDAEKRLNYIKGTIARHNKKALYPFIKITRNTKFYREVYYTITLPDQKPVTGLINLSRRTSDYILSLSKDKRTAYFMDQIASLNARLLTPYVSIDAASDDFRTIDYSITIPE